MRASRFVFIGCIVLAAWGGGCRQDEPPPDPEEDCTSFDVVHEDVFVASCIDANCHNGESTDLSDLDLLTPGADSRMIGVTAAGCDRVLVRPGDPEGSFLYEKVAAPSPACGAPMPTDRPFDEAGKECIRTWIASLDCERCGGDSCVFLNDDPMNCGACGRACPGDASCGGGECQCDGERSYCAGSCVDIASDHEHCGGCDAPCTSGLLCSLGSCKDSCDAGLEPCSGSCVDTLTNRDHCGGCGAPCGPNEACLNGSCACEGGADTQTDPNNCGQCGNVCAPGQSCVAGECTCGSTTVSFSGTIQPIFTASCMGNGCHAGSTPAGELNLEAGQAYQQLVGVAVDQCGAGRMRVVAGEPSSSYLVDKLLGTDMCFGSPMPKMGALPMSDIEAISTWICNGAPNN